MKKNNLCNSKFTSQYAFIGNKDIHVQDYINNYKKFF